MCFGPEHRMARVRNEIFLRHPRSRMMNLGVRDIAAFAKFDAKGLGFPRLERPPRVAFFTLNGRFSRSKARGTGGGCAQSAFLDRLA